MIVTGVCCAKAEGKYRGRKSTARPKSGEIRKIVSEGVGKVEIAQRLGQRAFGVPHFAAA